MHKMRILFMGMVLLLAGNELQAQQRKTGNKPAAATKTTATQPVLVKSAVEENTVLKLGRYELYAGVQGIHIGHVILQQDGKYKVAFDGDEDNYDELGKYIFHPETTTIEWIGGMFKANNWGGKLTKKEGNNKTRIEFNPTSYAESK